MQGQILSPLSKLQKMNLRTSTNKTVLIITDCSGQFALTATMLENDGYRVYFESDMHCGLDFVKARSPKIIISELAAPSIDGLELCCHLRAEDGLDSSLVLLVGDLSCQSAIVTDGLRCGAVDYLQKPIDGIELFELCNGLLATDANTNASFDLDDNHFHKLIESISDAVIIVDANSRILLENPSACNIFGYDRGELLGKKLTDLVHPADVGGVVEHLDFAPWITSIAEPIEYRFRHKNRSWILAESVARKITPARLGAVVVTLRKKRPEKFSLAGALENDVLRKVMFDNASIGMAVMSFSGHITEINGTLVRMLDEPVEALYGMSLSEIIIPYDAQADRRALTEVLNGQRDHYQFRNGYYLPNGDLLWGRLTVVAVPQSAGSNRCLIVIFEDPFSDNLDGEILDARPVMNAKSGISNVLDLTRWKA